MATFYIDSPEYGILELTSTATVKVVDTTTPTKHKLESGEEIADHLVNNNREISFNGLISDIRKITVGLSDARGSTSTSSSASDPVSQYIDTLYRIRDRKLKFNVIYDSRFPSASNCVVTSITKERNAATGKGYDITLAIEQLRFGSAANITVERDNQANPDTTQEVTNTDGSNTEDAGPSLSLAASGTVGINNLIFGGDE